MITSDQIDEIIRQREIEMSPKKYLPSLSSRSGSLSSGGSEGTMNLRVGAKAPLGDFKGRARLDLQLELRRKEEELSFQAVCPIDTLSDIMDTIGSLNLDAFAELLEERWDEREVMVALSCVVESFISDFNTHPPPSNERIRTKLIPTALIGENSVRGYAFQTNLQYAEGLFVLKTPRDNGDVLHEYIVGTYGTNLLRDLVPNFAYIFGIFDCSQPIVSSSGSVEAWCNTEENSVDYVIYENIAPSVTLEEYLRDCTYIEFLNIYLQVLYALRRAYREIDFTHYDLHVANVLLRRVRGSKIISILYETENGEEYLVGEYVATLIDFGQSHIRYRGESYGYSGFEEFGIYPDRSHDLFDAYKLLLSSLWTLRKFGNKATFNKATQLVRFFNPKEPIHVILDRQAKHYFSLPVVPVTVDDYLRYIRNLELIPFMRPLFIEDWSDDLEDIGDQEIGGLEESKGPEGRILGASSHGNVDDNLRLMGLTSSITATNIPEFYDLLVRFTTFGTFDLLEELRENFDYPGYLDIHLNDYRYRMDNILSGKTYDSLAERIDTYQQLRYGNIALEEVASFYNDTLALLEVEKHKLELEKLRLILLSDLSRSRAPYEQLSILREVLAE